MSTRDQIADAAAELRKLIDRLEAEAIGALDSPSMERLAAFDGHRRLLESSLTIVAVAWNVPTWPWESSWKLMAPDAPAARTAGNDWTE